MLSSTRKTSDPIAPSELVLNADGSVYHLKLLPEQVARKIIVVGDQDRVARISQHFEQVEHKIENREFVTHTGTFNGTPVTALSTGIGCDNIDIVLNELDAAVNIDLNMRLPKSDHTTLEIVRLGTSGSLQEDIPVDSFVVSEYGLGFDGLLHFYQPQYEADELEVKAEFLKGVNWPRELNDPYLVKANPELLQIIGKGLVKGITATANGFYAPQGRELRLSAAFPDINDRLRDFSWNEKRITNFEMETSALYGLSSLLGHKACTVCAIIANRYRKEYSKDYKKSVDELIGLVLQRLTA